MASIAFASPQGAFADSTPDRDAFYPAGSLFVLGTGPVDTGLGQSPLTPTLALGLEAFAGLTPFVRGGLFFDYGLGGVDADAYGDRFDRQGGKTDNSTLRGGLRLRVSPFSLLGVLPFADASVGLGMSKIELHGEEVCTTVNGERECEPEVLDEASFSGWITSVGVGLEIDPETLGDTDTLYPGDSGLGKIFVRGAYGWYFWTEKEGPDTPDKSMEARPEVVEIDLGVTFW